MDVEKGRRAECVYSSDHPEKETGFAVSEDSGDGKQAGKKPHYLAAFIPYGTDDAYTWVIFGGRTQSHICKARCVAADCFSPLQNTVLRIQGLSSVEVFMTYGLKRAGLSKAFSFSG